MKSILYILFLFIFYTISLSFSGKSSGTYLIAAESSKTDTAGKIINVTNSKLIVIEK